MKLSSYTLFNCHRRECWGDILRDLRSNPCFENIGGNGLLRNIVTQDFQIIEAYDATAPRTDE
jgi:hypothetical protein